MTTIGASAALAAAGYSHAAHESAPDAKTMSSRSIP